MSGRSVAPRGRARRPAGVSRLLGSRPRAELTSAFNRVDRHGVDQHPAYRVRETMPGERLARAGRGAARASTSGAWQTACQVGAQCRRQSAMRVGAHVRQQGRGLKFRINSPASVVSMRRYDRVHAVRKASKVNRQPARRYPQERRLSGNGDKKRPGRRRGAFPRPQGQSGESSSSTG